MPDQNGRTVVPSSATVPQVRTAISNPPKHDHLLRGRHVETRGHLAFTACGHRAPRCAASVRGVVRQAKAMPAADVANATAREIAVEQLRESSGPKFYSENHSVIQVIARRAVSSWRREWDSCQVAASRRAARRLKSARTARTERSEWTGGESGIRTHGTVSRTHAFQACSIDHSDISPFRINNLRSLVDRDGRDCDKSPMCRDHLRAFQV